MSFILDALKKSETDRQQQGSAEFATVPAGGARPGTPNWIWALIVLLGINIVAVLWLVLKPGPTGEPASDPVVVATTPEAAVVPQSEPEPGPEPSFEQRVAEARASQPPVAAAEPAAAQASVVAEPAPAPARPAQVADGLPTFLDLRVGGQVSLPDLHLDIHVYSDVPADRFVFINMNKHREGATLSEGPKVWEITVDGVVLDYQGRRFKLPRE